MCMWYGKTVDKGDEFIYLFTMCLFWPRYVALLLSIVLFSASGKQKFLDKGDVFVYLFIVCLFWPRSMALQSILFFFCCQVTSELLEHGDEFFIMQHVPLLA